MKTKRADTVPDEFHRQLIQALEENNIFRQLAHVIHTSSGTRTIPIAADNGKASWVEEGNAIGESDLTFNVQTRSAYKLPWLGWLPGECAAGSHSDSRLLFPAILRHRLQEPQPRQHHSVYRVKQYDRQARRIRCTLFEGFREYSIPSGASLICSGARPDGYAIAKESAGIPRVINRICEKSLMYAFQLQRKLVDDYMVNFVLEHEIAH